MLCRSVGLLAHVVTLLLDTGSLTSELAQIVKLSATNLTNLVYFDALALHQQYLTSCEQ